MTRKILCASLVGVLCVFAFWTASDAGSGSLLSRAKAFASARERLLCNKCDGKVIVPCSRCKGRGWLYRYYGGGRKINWDRSVACPRCNAGAEKPKMDPACPEMHGKPRNMPTAGKQRCSSSFCLHGFNRRYIERVFWDMRAGEVKNSIFERLEGITSTAYLEAVALVHSPGLPQKERTERMNQIAGELDLSAGQIREVVKVTAPEEWFRDFGRAVPEETDEPNVVRVRFLRYDERRRPAGEFVETQVWVEEDGTWNIVDLRY